ncbi:MAG TPA: class I SAM-dependent methyltransferase [Candidatus Limnocylindria bacterium]|nr:class I SAM-dependent methyltransferase [Candidatus Limnocylindria bacterium]
MSHNTTSNNKFFKAPRYLFRKYNILNLIQTIPVKTFADVGCGAGELACSLAQRGYKGVGIDFSDDALAVANGIRKERGLTTKQLSFNKGSLSVLPKKSDLIICCEVIEHLEDDNKFLQDVKKYGDYFIFSVPARMQWFDQFDEKVGHFRRYEKGELIKQLEKHGYVIKRFSSYGYPFINVTRLMRKALAGKVKKQKNAEEMTKQSGINPIKTKYLQLLNIEPFLLPLYWMSRPFNRYNLSEGYVVLCQKKQ